MNKSDDMFMWVNVVKVVLFYVYGKVVDKGKKEVKVEEVKKVV